MAVDYLQDLVQNIYTNCDMSGFNNYNRATQNLTKVSTQGARERIKLVEAEEKAKIRLADYEDRYARKKKQRDLDEISRMQKRNSLIKAGMRLIGTYLSIRTLQNIIQTGSKLQLLQRSIQGLTGSEQDWEFINQQAFKFGVSLDTVAKGYKNFYSSANMAGFDKNQIQGMFSDVLLGARAIGASTPSIEGALLALEQMMSKGRVSMEELRRQLGNALPGAFEIGAKAMGVTTAAFNDLISKGLSANEFVPKFIKTFKEQYANGWKDVEQTVAVAQGRLQVAWQQFTMEFLHGESGKALAEGINALADMLRTPEFTQFIHILGKIFALVSKIFTWVIKYHKIILMFLGSAGLYGLIMKNSIAFELLHMNIKHAAEMLLWFGKAGIASFKGLGAGAKLLQGAIFKTLLPLLAIEDIVLGLGQFFLGWNVRSLLGDALTSMKELNDIKKDPYGIKNLNQNLLPQAFANNLQYNPNFQKAYNQAITSGNFNELPNLYGSNYSFNPSAIRRGESIYIPGATAADIPGYLTGPAADINFEKEEVNNNNISMGDIHFHIEGAGDPYIAAGIFKEELLNLFTGQLGGVTT